MEIWPIDFDKTLQEISEWLDGWKVERFGSDILNPERYYKVTPDEKGRYLYGDAEGESLNQEKADCDKALELLVRIKNINDRLKGKGLSQHLQWRERERLKGERETLYKDFLDIVTAVQVPQRGELLYYCQIAVEQGLLEKTETGYKRIKEKMSKAQLAYLLGYFFNSDGTFPETKYNKMFDESRLGKALYQISGNKNGGGKPRGYEIIDKLLLM
jgi:hypothetical protein